MSLCDTQAWPPPLVLPSLGEAAVGREIPLAMTVDLEDWAQGLLGGDTPITDRVVQNVDRLLDLLQRSGVTATFFALGKVCEHHPQILPRVAAAGHEIGSHGYGHEAVFRLTPRRFAEDVRRSVEIIGEQTGRAPVGYRAPQFSVTMNTLWFIDVLQDLGFRYSSSVFPIRGRRYGIAQAPGYPFRWSAWLQRLQGDSGGAPGYASESRLIEFPMTTLSCLGRRWPVCGGGYLRLLPALVARWAIRQQQAAGRTAVLYMHPYELDVHEVRELRHELKLPAWTALKQGLFRSRFQGRLACLLAQNRFQSMRSILGC